MPRKTSPETRKLILKMLCEGNSIRGVSRVTGVEKKTIGRIILQFGQACQTFLDEMLRGLKPKHLEIDEIWSWVSKKQAHLTIEEKETRHDIGDVYMWTALDSETKLLCCYAIGKRSADMARRFMMDLASRVVLPGPGSADDANFVTGSYPIALQISTDGFAAYPEAVDLAFGPFVKYGTIIKDYRNATMIYTPSEMVGTKREARQNMGEDEVSTICTSHVERNNGTIRTLVKRFCRLTMCFSKKLENHAAACAMFVAYYNFVWRTRYPDNSGRPGKLRPTAAMMAKVVPDLWNFDRLYNEVCKYG
jgi:IS1 family transposase